MSTVVEEERGGTVLHVRFDRPDRRNALDVAAVREVNEALESAATSEHLRVVLISGTGDHFCAGADWVSTNQSGSRPRAGSIQRRTPLQAHRLVELLVEVQLPVVCSVRGWAAGLGCQIALAGDFTVASEESCFWEPFMERGFSPDSGASWFLPRLVGLVRAKELVLLGRKLSGREAADWGLIHRAVPDADLEGTVDELVGRLAEAPTVAVGLAKRSLHRGLHSSLAEALDVEAAGLELTSRTADFKEGLAAFRERRPPRFEGR